MKRIIKLITWYAVMCLSGGAGAVGIVCLKGKDRINFLSPIRLDGVFNRNINEIVSMLVLSICLYFSMVWIGNIHKFLKDMG